MSIFFFPFVTVYPRPGIVRRTIDSVASSEHSYGSVHAPSKSPVRSRLFSPLSLSFLHLLGLLDIVAVMLHSDCTCVSASGGGSQHESQAAD